MERVNIAILAVTVCWLGGCAPGAVQSIRLTPAEACTYERGNEFMAQTISDPKLIEQYLDTVTTGGDSLRIFVSLREFPDYIEANVELTNAAQRDFTVAPSMFAMLDGRRTALSPIEASAVANEMLANIQAIPEYQPKYNYRIQSSVYGSATTQYQGGGQYYTRYNATGNSTVTAQEDPYHALGYSIGAIFAQAANNKVRACARRIYERGIGISADLMARSRGAFTVYWRNTKAKTYPLRFVIRDTDIEFTFERRKSAPVAQSGTPQPTGALAD